MVRLQDFFQEKKPYSNPELTVVDVSVALNLHPKIISKAINTLTDKNFNRFVNSFRVNRAKVLLTDFTMKNITIDGVGREVGFQSKSSFYGAFKTMVGTTPLEYQKQHLPTK
jgi:YesN/AraC family two-component response regulator